MSQLRQEDIRALEQTRQRLLQLSQSIGSLKSDVLRTSPMPPWESLQLSASILAQNLKSITDHMKTHSDLFDKMVTYPSTSFPGRTQEGLLGQLLRKKLEPGVERWVEEGKAMATSPAQDSNGQDMDMDKLENEWQVAREFIGERIARAAVTHRRDEYTSEEREMGIENVNTGLMKSVKAMKLKGEDEESDSDEDGDEDDEMEDVGDVKRPTLVQAGPKEGARTLDEIVRFTTIGIMPEDEVQVNGIGFRR